MKYVPSLVLLFGVVSWVSCDIGNKVQFVDITNIVPIDSRIIGGNPVTIERYPFAVQIIFSGSLSCGGSLLTVQNVLSAAHCFVRNNQLINTRNLRVRAGTTNNNSGGTSVRVSAIIIHERYNIPVRDNDIAILRTSSQFSLSSRIGVAFIPLQNNELPDGMPLIYVGWGTTSVNVQQTSPILMHVTVLKINRTICASRYQHLQETQMSPFPVTENMMCAGLLDVGGADACQGDSGGPLLFSNNVVVGVTSWGYLCGHAQYPGVSARVARYSQWINITVTSINGSPSVSESRIVILFTLICAMFHWHFS